jgi:hypothetical protein
MNPGDNMPEEPKASGGTENETTSGNALHKKLGMRTQGAGLIIAPPQDEDNPLFPLPDGFKVLASLDELAAVTGKFEYIHVFARDRTALATAFSGLRDKLTPNGSLWISWMKQSSRGRGLFGDLNENVVRRLALTHAMVDVKVASLDRDWAALRLVHRRH